MCSVVCLFCGCQSAPKTEACADSATENSTSWIARIDHWHWFDSPPPPPPPADNLVLHGDRLEPDIQLAKGKAAADLAGAHVLYRDGKFSEAERFFHRVAENTKNAPQIAEEARYYEAECLRRQGALSQGGRYLRPDVERLPFRSLPRASGSAHV